MNEFGYYTSEMLAGRRPDHFFNTMRVRRRCTTLGENKMECTDIKRIA